MNHILKLKSIVRPLSNLYGHCHLHWLSDISRVLSLYSFLFHLLQIWPHSDYPLIPVGKMVLDRNPSNYFAEIEQSAFNPASMVPGIEPSPDKMLQVSMSLVPSLVVIHSRILHQRNVNPFNMFILGSPVLISWHSSSPIGNQLPAVACELSLQDQRRRPQLPEGRTTDLWKPRQDTLKISLHWQATDHQIEYFTLDDCFSK